MQSQKYHTRGLGTGLAAGASMEDGKASDYSAATLFCFGTDQDVAGFFCGTGIGVLYPTDPRTLDTLELEEVEPDLVILDQTELRSTNPKLIQQLWESKAGATIPVLVLLAESNPISRAHWLDRGADAVLTKPYNSAEFVAVVRSLLRRRRGSPAMLSPHPSHAVATEVPAPPKLDPLSGLLNHTAVHHVLYQELAHSLSKGHPLSCLLLDIDRFREVNYTLGHLAGDEILREISRRIVAHLRTEDAAGRYGGDQFVILLPSAGPDQARETAECLRVAVGTTPFTVGTQKHHLTASIGIASFPQSKIMNRSQLILHAGHALEDAKRLGHNRVCIYAERRAAQRFRIDADACWCANGEKTPREARALDLSSTGASIAVHVPLKVGTPVYLGLRLRTPLPEDSRDIRPTIKALGHVAWSKDSIRYGGMYDTGVHFRKVEAARIGSIDQAVYAAMLRDVTSLADPTPSQTVVA